MTDISTMFVTDKPYATAADYEGISQQDTIAAAGTDEYNGEHFVWVKLSAIEKPIRLNKTNGRALMAFGSNTDQWLNKPVFVTTASGQFDNGKTWVGWRISAIQQAQPAATQPGTELPNGKIDTPFNDDIPL